MILGGREREGLATPSREGGSAPGWLQENYSPPKVNPEKMVFKTFFSYALNPAALPERGFRLGCLVICVVRGSSDVS